MVGCWWYYTKKDQHNWGKRRGFCTIDLKQVDAIKLMREAIIKDCFCPEIGGALIIAFVGPIATPQKKRHMVQIRL